MKESLVFATFYNIKFHFVKVVKYIYILFNWHKSVIYYSKYWANSLVFFCHWAY